MRFHFIFCFVIVGINQMAIALPTLSHSDILTTVWPTGKLFLTIGIYAMNLVGKMKAPICEGMCLSKQFFQVSGRQKSVLRRGIAPATGEMTTGTVELNTMWMWRIARRSVIVWRTALA